ncbi:MAG TPA: glycosyltransferase [Candidatus Dormibacteraeota bacterium]|nr:glycosyltransferase [Candidatus Dormibacteraeota bacterium]
MTAADRSGTGTIYVLAPVHNRRAITERFVRCLAAQTDQGFHLVLVDDGSKDGTADAVRSILPSSTVIRGSGHWWWAGSLEQARRWLRRQPQARGDVVLIVNDDTRFEPDFLRVARSAIGATERTLLLAQPFSEQTGEALPLGTKIDWAKLRFTPALRPEDIDCFSTRGLFLRRTDFEELGGFHTVLLPHYLSDYEFTIRASRRGFSLRSDPSVRLVMDETSTGIRQKDHRSVWAYLRSVLTIRATANPIYWSSFVLLTSPRRFVLSNLSIVWMRFGRDLARSARPNVVANP